ncbi:MAG TPA: hypothetical protein VJ953_01030 [Saprospiraceae bacterium]|nr:hypothetical protein [Saprospiraceae bacterium]
MLITKKEFNSLLAYHDNPAVSIFIPTSRESNFQKDQLYLKNALKEAGNQLEAKGMNSKEVHKFLANAHMLLDDGEYWNHLSDGLALFIGKNFFHKYELPVSFEEMVHVNDQFYLRPIMPMMSGEGRFFLLALSQNEVKFFEGTKYSITPVIIDDLVPQDMESILIDVGTKESLQHHDGGGIAAIFHGQGRSTDDDMKNVRKYFRQIDEGLMTMLHDENVPMVIAAVDHLVPVYKEISGYNNIVHKNISGNPEDLSPVELHERAMNIMKNFQESTKDEIKDNFDDLLASDKASFGIIDIVKSAHEGKVEHLFLKNDYQNWGTYDPSKRLVTVHKEKQADSKDLLEVAARYTYQHGGTMHSCDREELPRPTANANATYRYQ